MKNMAPNRANISRMTSTTPADSEAERNSLRGSSGWRARDSRMTNSSPSSAAEGQGAGGRPAVVRALDQPPDQQEQRTGQGGDAGDVERGGVRRDGGFAQHEQAHDQRGGADRDVDVEAGFPADVLDQQPAHDRPGGRGRADDRAPHADGPVQLADRARPA